MTTPQSPEISGEPPGRRLVLADVILMSVSLALIAAVGLSEAHDTYARLHRQTIEASGKMVQHRIQHVLQGGVPLGQISNLASMLQPLRAQPAIERVAVLDADHALLVEESPGTGASDAHATACEELRFTLQSRTGAAGTLVLCARTAHASDLVWSRFSWLVPVSIVVIALVTLLVHWLVARRGRRRGRRRALVRNLLHMAAFAAILAGTVGTLIGIYRHGIQARLEGMATALAARLEAPLALGIPLAAFTEIEDLLEEYRREDERAIRYIVLLSDNEVLARTGEADDRASASPPALRDHYRIIRSLAGEAPALGAPGVGLRLEIWVSKAFLYARLWAAIKNLLTLILALMLMARLFQGLVTSVETRLVGASAGHAQGHHAVAQAKPFYALVVLAEGLGASFLPGFFAAEAGTAMVSVLVTTYFAAFALCLIPAGRYAERHGATRLLYAGPALIALGLVAMAGSHVPIALLIARVLCGAGQGMILMGTQSFLLRATGGRGSDVLVTGFHAGLIAGTALGALLVRYTAPREVFATAAVIVLFALLYARLILHGPAPDRATAHEKGSLHGFLRVLQDRQFRRAVFLAGLPSRLIHTGVFVLATPLLLARLGYQADDIGQIMIFHAVSVLGTSQLVSRLAPDVSPVRLLVIGLFGHGLGLLCLAAAADASMIVDAGPRTIALVASFMLLGGGLALVGAPSLQYAISAPAVRVVGIATSATLCRLVERAGQALGPTLIGPLMLQAGAGTRVIGWLGMGALGLGLLLAFASRSSRPGEQEEPEHA